VAEPPVALVSGGNRGIGLEVCRQLAGHGYAVIMGSRDPDSGAAAAKPLADEGLSVWSQRLDVTDQESVDALRGQIDRYGGRLEVLVNNAGIHPSGKASEIDVAVVEQAWQVNALGAWRLAVAMVPFMLARGRGRIVNVSSDAGSLETMDAAMPAYNVSKAALNAITRVLAADLRGTGILVNSVSPGWARTDMGGPMARRSVEEGAASVLWAALLPDDGPTGGFFRDGEPRPW
jgi:NAD(P)-dependent dehydrogenase (short-subunit alcohol dehydrogenase family)